MISTLASLPLNLTYIDTIDGNMCTSDVIGEIDCGIYGNIITLRFSTHRHHDIKDRQHEE